MSGRAALLALTLGGSALVAMPAQAASPSFNFQFGTGDGGSVTFGTGHDRFRHCLSDRQVRRGLERNGFDNVRIGRERSRSRVEVTADYGRWRYSMTVNRCSGEVTNIDRLRRHSDDRYFRGPGPGRNLGNDRSPSFTFEFHN